MVKPMPASSPVPITCLQLLPPGKVEMPDFTRINTAPLIPSVFPIRSPDKMPRLSGVLKSGRGLEGNSIAVLARANRGKMNPVFPGL